ncbi:5'-AMP-activated protein kinase beta subunit, interation domain-containing protein [Dactylonectria macrodidyma]|uniref:5'-AMP-activated protein kinase beta subunit, interation domain-containing protein n=1 Tax=Dactylonectria macrodidyma TaxID=307937 RepID=A0A9P9FLJ9_9HYPO|nr:5'-AMP-activated protein kinase beta subunit, interation domain-containing protein [Dactylonectria macrodidyma]
MGNNPSTSSKPATPTSSTPTTSAPGSAHDSPRHHRRDARNIIPGHTHRSAAPPEPSLAQAQGSTIVNRPKSLPTTAVSSLSGSPHSNASAPVKPTAPAEAKPALRDEPSKPVAVPIESSSLRSHHSTLPEVPLVSNNSITDMYLTRPPRLPLPIEEEVHTPGSPILAPEQDSSLPEIEQIDSSDGITRKSSALSATTVDEEEGEELRVDKTRPTVPTKLEWRRGGEKVYVTGTIFQWNRKQRLHPVEGSPGCFAATIHILPGTHHVRFLVDGIMQTSPDLPTTVDFGNNLVNYIEVNPDDALQVIPPPSAPKPETEPAAKTHEEQPMPPQPQQHKGKEVPPLESYRHPIPAYLLDFDQPEDSPAYQYAVSAIEKLPNPPSLPGFLSKPVLNAATLMKDDNSVLNMPNHTILNHLATSSIKNNILAVSATTRYRDKYVTTIMYKPTSTDEG